MIAQTLPWEVIEGVFGVYLIRRNNHWNVRYFDIFQRWHMIGDWTPDESAMREKFKEACGYGDNHNRVGRRNPARTATQGILHA